MKKNITKTRSAILYSLILMFAVICMLASCDPGKMDTDPLNEKTSKHISAQGSETSSSNTTSTKEGLTKTPVISDIINILPDELAVYGTCEENAVITIKGGVEEVVLESVDEYFIAAVKIEQKKEISLDITAKIPDKEESESVIKMAKYDATATKRNENSVSVGLNSSLYFDKNMQNFTGENLCTQAMLRDFKTNLNTTVNYIVGKSLEGQGNIIYVLVPDVTSVKGGILPTDITKKTYSTRYGQLVDTLKSSNADVIDMLEIFKKEIESSQYYIYRKTDSGLTEYGAYLVYKEICGVISEKFPAAVARDLKNDFDVKTEKALGGNLVKNLGLSDEIITETLTLFTPKFNMKIGSDGKSATVNLSDINKYAGNGDYSFKVAQTSAERVVGSRFIARTQREELPCAMIYRSDVMNPMIDILAERFNNVLVARENEFAVNLTDGTRYSFDGKSFVDYVFVILSESDIDKIIK